VKEEKDLYDDDGRRRLLDDGRATTKIAAVDEQVKYGETNVTTEEEERGGLCARLGRDDGGGRRWIC
jgi:hypothetical protein